MASELKNNNILCNKRRRKKNSFRFRKLYNRFTLIRSSVAKSQNEQKKEKNERKLKKSSKKKMKGPFLVLDAILYSCYDHFSIC